MRSLALALAARAASLLVSGVLGCGPGHTPDASVPLDAACTVDGGAVPWIVLGTGQERFVDLAPGAELELVLGPQGGYHLDVTALFGLAVSPDMHVLRYEAARTDGTELGVMQIALLERRLTRACGGWLRDGDILVLAITGPADVVGDELDVTVSVLDARGEVARDTRRVRVVDRE